MQKEEKPKEAKKAKVPSNYKPFVVLFNKNNFNNKVSKNPTEQQHVSAKEFLDKYQDRYETIGREGVKGIIKSSSIQVNNPRPYNNINRSLPQSQSYLPPINNQSLFISPVENTKSKTPLIYNPKSKGINITEWKQYPNVIPITNKKTEVLDANKLMKHNIFLERSYIPHTYKEYTNVMREYKNNRFGGLGPNLGTKEWSRRAIKFRKMNEYGVNVVANFQGVKKYKRESPDEERKLNLERIYKKSKRYITKKYGEGVMLNKLRKQKEMERLEKEFYEQNLLQEQKEKEEEEECLFTNSREKYIERLNKLKESLIKGI